MAGTYPEIKPYATHQLQVDAVHALYIEESGEPEGIPVIFLHGGPGAGCEPNQRRFFDPNKYRIILFDQRGCGRSAPHAELEGNDTWNLVSDIESIRELLGVNSWLVFGGSWGSTLALAYAETHPDRVLGLVLRGIFLCRPREIGWFYQQGANRIFPDYWQEYLSVIPESERDDMLSAYYSRLTGADEIARMAAAKAWSIWEARTASIMPNRELIEHFGDPHVALSLASIECHYFINNAFLQPDQLLDNADRLADVPGIIIHGRHDLICPLESAWALHQAWPNSDLRIIEGAGHAATEPAITKALIQATDYFAERIE